MTMKVLVACEYSGRVRRAFAGRGHEVYSCDLLPADDGETTHHYQGDVLDIINGGWDLMIAFPPCTHLAVSGARWFKDKVQEQQEALDFVQMLMNADIPKIAIENPISIISSRIRKPDQIVQPWWFGDTVQKSTCLWLKGLPLLTKTNDVYKEMMELPRKEREKIWYASPGPDRWKARSTTFPGFAAAMALQWG